MKSRTRNRLVLAIVLCLASPGFAEDRPLEKPLSDLSWVHAGFWGSDGQLVLLDRREKAAYQTVPFLGSNPARAVQVRKAPQPADEAHWVVQHREATYVLLDSPQYPLGIYVLEKDKAVPAKDKAVPRLRLQQSDPTGAFGSDRPISIVQIYDFFPMGPRGFFVFAEFCVGECDEETAFTGFAFVREALGGRILDIRGCMQFPLAGTTSTNYYTTVGSHPYLAVLSDKKAAFLSLDNGPLISECTLEPGKEDMKLRVMEGAVPSDYRATIHLQASSREPGPTKATSFIRMIEATATPVGLYSLEGKLCALAKSSPRDGNRIDWEFYCLDTSGSIYWRKPLRTHAPNNTVVLGSKFVAFVEKGWVVPENKRQEPLQPIWGITVEPTPDPEPE